MSEKKILKDNRFELTFKQIQDIGESERISTEIVKTIMLSYNNNITIEDAITVYKNNSITHENWDEAVKFYNENFDGEYEKSDLQLSNAFTELSNGLILELD